MRGTSYISNFYIVDIQVFEFSKCAKSSAFSETSYTTALEANFFTLRSNFQSTKRPCIIQIADHCKLLPELFGSILSIKCRDSMDGTFKFLIPSINQGLFMDGSYHVLLTGRGPSPVIKIVCHHCLPPRPVRTSITVKIKNDILRSSKQKKAATCRLLLENSSKSSGSGSRSHDLRIMNPTL